MERLESPLRSTLPKCERLCKKRIIDTLFGSQGKSMLAYPMRVVYMPLEASEPTQIMVIVPKKRFHRAVKRNRVKRQMREAYRKQKELLLPQLQAKGISMAMAFIWIDDKLHPSGTVDEKMRNLLVRIGEKMNSHA